MLFSKGNKENGKWIILIAFLFAIIILSFFLQNVNSIEQQDNQLEYEHLELIGVTQLDQKTEMINAESIDLSVRKDNLYIDNAKEYVLSGETTFPIIIDVQDEVIHLFFNNVSVSSAQGPALYIKSAGKVIITLLPETVNTFRDTTSNMEFQATISSECNLTINGQGALKVYGYCKDGVRTKDVLKLLADNVYVKAKRDGLRGNDGVYIKSQKLSIECEGNGIRATNGMVDLSGGELSVVSGKNGVKASSDVYIHDCSFTGKSVLDLVNTNGKKYIEEGCVKFE